MALRRNPINTILSSVVSLFRRSARIETGERVTINRQRQQVTSFSTSEFWGNENFQRRLLYAPIRDSVRAQLLNRLAQVPETETMVQVIANDILSSEFGDDIGVKIDDELTDGTPVDPEIQRIGNDAIQRLLTVDVLMPIITGFLEDGDCFRSLVLDPGITRINRVKDLPTWEMFRIEDGDGQVLQFEQRQHLADDKDSLILHPAICVHWRFRRRGLYGRSLWECSASTIDNMDSGYISLNKAAIAVGVNETKHIMPEGWGAEQTQAYKRNHENRLKRNEVITNYYLYNGADVDKVSSQWPDLSGLISNVENHKRRLAMVGRIPPYLLGLEASSATKDLSGAPQLAYVRFIGGVRQCLSTGIKQIIDLELALNGYLDPDARQYRLKYPKLHTDTQQQDMAAEDDQDGSQSNQNSEELDALIANYRSYLNGSSPLVLSNGK